jgi:3-oxoacyl-[acyl-carrier-protein] synthase II
VAITGAGAVTSVIVGGADAIREAIRSGVPADSERVDRALAELVDPAEARRLSRVCQLALAAARLAVQDARAEGRGDLALIVGTELGDLRSTIAFADGYLARGPAGLSPLLFPNTVMNTMAAVTAIPLAARELSLTINAPTVAGELAVIRGADAIRAGRAEAVLAGGVDELDPTVASVLVEARGRFATRGEGAAFLLLEPLEAAQARGARILGEIVGAASGALSAPPYGVGRMASSRVVSRALAQASTDAAAIDTLYTGESGDLHRDAWEGHVLDGFCPRRIALARRFGQTSALGPLKVLAAAAGARGLVHGLARGGSEAALVVA